MNALSPKERLVPCDVLADMLRVLLPSGGYAMIEAQAYFDESGSHDGAAILCVAGYIFKKSEAIKLGPVSYTHLDVYKRQHHDHGTCPGARPVDRRR